MAKLMLRLLGITLSVVMLVGSNTSSATEATSEQALTVAFLYNFLKFAEWPTGTATSGLALCVANSANFGEELDAISGRSAQDKVVQIKRIELGDNARDCQLLFLPRGEKPVRIREWLKNTEKSPTLMVSDIDDFLEMGGMITLISDGTRLQFEVNLERVRHAGLNLNSRLLKLARKVIQ